MRLILDEPAGWRTSRDGDWTLALSPDRSVRVLATPLFGRATDLRQVFERDVPAGGRIEYLAFEDGQRTRTGWSMALTTLRIVDAHGTEIEHRVAAVYMMLTYLGAAVARMPCTANREPVIALLASARPHLWSAEPAGVAELFTLEEP